MARGSINTLKTKTLNQSFQKLKLNQLCKAWHVFAKHQRKTSCTIRGLTWYKDAQHDSAVSTHRPKLISTDTLPAKNNSRFFLFFGGICTMIKRESMDAKTSCFGRPPKSCIQVVNLRFSPACLFVCLNVVP